VFRLPRIAVGAIAIAVLLVSGFVGVDAASATPGTGSIHGVVTAPDGSVPDGPVTVNLAGATSIQTQADGSYSFTGLPAGQYDLTFDYGGSSKIVAHERWDGTFSPSGNKIVLADGEDRVADVRLVAGADVSGAVTGIDGALDATTTITLVWRGTSTAYTTSGTFDVAHQTWQVADVPPGRYTVIVKPTPRWQTKQWGYLTVTEGVDLVDTAHQLPRSTEIGGTVSYVDNGVTLPLPDGAAWAWNHSGGEIYTPIVDGRYDFYGLNAGTYSICFQEQNFVDLTCVGPQGFYDPPNVTVANNQVLDSVNMTVTRGGQLVGQLVGTGTPQWEVRLLRKDAATGSYGNEVDDYPTASGSGFFFNSVPPGTYRLQVIDTSNTNEAQYWRNARDAQDATDIVIAPGQTLDLGTITTVARTFTFQRTDGIDRFEVSAGVSQARFATVPPDGVPIVYVSNGLNYPDALSAGPAAIKNGGVLLLVTPTSIPSSIAAELTRLRPQRIVVVGGPGSVSDSVLHQLDAYVTGPSGKAERLSGTDRFEASRNLARATFLPGGAPTVFIATGNNYPDALSAGPAAGSIGAPVILVDGLAPHLDSETMKLLHDLGTTSVDIVGGPASVSPGIQEDVVALVGVDHITIFGGDTRYENAAQLGETFFRYTDTAFFATGTNFPDALSAAALAGFEHAPIDLVQPTCVPPSVDYWIGAQQVQHIWLIGGPASLGQGVENRTQCSN